MDPVDNHRIFNTKSKEHTFYSATQKRFSKTGHILEYKTKLYKFKKIEITPCILPDHSAVKPNIDGKL